MKVSLLIAINKTVESFRLMSVGIGSESEACKEEERSRISEREEEANIGAETRKRDVRKSDKH